MQNAVSLVSVLVLGSIWTLQGVHTLPATPPLPQEDFHLDQFMGRWFEVAVVSTCPYYMQRKRGNPVVLALQLQRVASQGNFTMTATSVRNGSCQQKSTVYHLTDTSGRFFHRNFRFDADVDSFVVETNYDEFALMFLLSTEKPSGNETTIIKLYSRTVDVTPAVRLNYKTLVRRHGLSDEAIIKNHKKDECAPRAREPEPTTEHQISAPKKSKRNVVSPVDSHYI
ncbi:protein AMBP-like [Limanda limanda]|uniref:protein AMBP-like n=1 Tax=Limanda limanda TaxID=27771 RepID=UPI0029C8A803|nr:protein AMBP-like [Limanda limanda]